MTVRNVDRYLTAVLDEYRETCAAGFSDEYAAKQALWKAAVIVWEVADDPEPWLDQLRNIALGVLKASRIEPTIYSARRRASGDGR
jgi:hypothetical protein